MIKEYNKEIGERLYDIVLDFIVKNKISHSDTIFQCDWVSENSLEFIDELCDITGYYEYGEDE